MPTRARIFTLLDSLGAALILEEQIFKANGIKAFFQKGEVNLLLFPDNSFNVIGSVGLLERFTDVRQPLHGETS